MPYLDETNYAEAMENTVMPYLAARRRETMLTAADGNSLHVQTYTADAPRGTVFFVHGFSESGEKFRELIYYCLERGLSALIYDQRGHGRSFRKAAARVTHIDRFEEYVEDLEAVYAAFSDTLPRPHALIAHSMGGAVSALYLQKHPDHFDRAALCAPMIAPRHDGLPLWVCRLVCGFCVCTGQGQKPLFSAGKDDAPDLFENSCALSRARFDYYQSLRSEQPVLSGGKPSYAWTYASLGVTRKILKKNGPERVKIPVRLYAAEDDRLVQAAPQQAWVNRLPNGSFLKVAGTKHEIYNAANPELFAFLDDLFAFLLPGENAQ